MNFYNWGNMQDPYTMFEDIYSLEGGSYKIIDYEGNVKNGKFANIKKRYQLFLYLRHKKCKNIKEK